VTGGDGQLVLPGPLAAALVDALGGLTDVARSGVGNYGRFPTLPAVLDVVRPVLHEFDLCAVPLVETEVINNNLTVATTRTMIVHRSGATFMSPPLRLGVASIDAQRVASGISYGRRYSLMATLNVAGDDDDGQAASSSSSQRSLPTPPTVGKTPEEAQARELLASASEEVREAIQRAFREHFGVSLSNLPRDRHAEALSFVIEQLDVPDVPEDLGESSYS